MSDYDEATQIAKGYYNSEDADNFYAIIWGGEDIHVGYYTQPGELIPEASHRMVDHIASRLKNVGPDKKAIDLGAGYGGAARFLAKRWDMPVVALNLSERENERDRTLNREQGLDHLIEVVDGSFDQVPYPDASFDLIWSQDSFLHSGDRQKVMQEIRRIAKPGCEVVFTDPMQSDDCDPSVLQPILDRLHLSSLGSPGFYRKALTDLGFEEIGYEDMTEQLVKHYSRVREELQNRREELRGKVSDEYTERMVKGLGHWVDGGKSGHMAWGILHFRLPG